LNVQDKSALKIEGTDVFEFHQSEPDEMFDLPPVNDSWHSFFSNAEVGINYSM
jgi:hypothetical protein